MLHYFIQWATSRESNAKLAIIDREMSDSSDSEDEMVPGLVAASNGHEVMDVEDGGGEMLVMVLMMTVMMMVMMWAFR